MNPTKSVAIITRDTGPENPHLKKVTSITSVFWKAKTSATAAIRIEKNIENFIVAKVYQNLLKIVINILLMFGICSCAVNVS